MIGMPSRMGYASFAEREISSCLAESHSSGHLVSGQTRISSNLGSTLFSGRSVGAFIKVSGDRLPVAQKIAAAHRGSLGRYHPQDLVEQRLEPCRRQRRARESEAEKRPIQDLRAGLCHRGGEPAPLQQRLDVVEPATVDRADSCLRGRIERRPVAHRALQIEPRAKSPAQQRLQRLIAVGLDIGDDLLGRDLAPALQHGRVERAEIDEMPIKTAARHAHGLCQWIGLQRREAAFAERLESLFDPVVGGELLSHVRSQEEALHYCIDRRPQAGPYPYSAVWMELFPCAIFCCNVPALPQSSWR